MTYSDSRRVTHTQLHNVRVRNVQHQLGKGEREIRDATGRGSRVVETQSLFPIEWGEATLQSIECGLYVDRVWTVCRTATMANCLIEHVKWRQKMVHSHALYATATRGLAKRG